MNQPKVHVTCDGCYVIVTGNIHVNWMTRQLEGSIVEMVEEQSGSSWDVEDLVCVSTSCEFGGS
jgi:hypothetical protein